MNYFEHHIGDYDQATAHLSAVEDGIYSRLIRWYMASEGPLPLDLTAIQRRVRAHSRDEKNAVKTILAEFFVQCDEGFHQHRCDEEIARFKEKQNKARKSAQARWETKRPLTGGDANASPEHDAQHMRTHDASNADGMHRAPVPTHQSPDTTTHPKDATEGAQRKRSATPPISRPADVAEQTWGDWLTLRKAKRAPVTETVVNNARSESELAGMSLDAFLQVWCARGSQGLQADWLKPHERQVASRMSFAEADEQRARDRWLDITGQRRSAPIDITPGNPALELLP